MEIKYNITGKERKEFVAAISDITGKSAKYLSMPTCAYAIGEDYKVTRDGNLEVSDNAKTNYTAWLMAQLEDRGYTPEPVDEVELVIEAVDEGTDEPVGFSIGMPITELSDKSYSPDTIDRLNSITEGYGELFKKALGTSAKLKTEYDDGNIWFDWFDRLITKDEQAVACEFFKALYRFAEKAKRVNGKRGEIENEKFTMRTFLNRIGLSGTEYKPLRKALLRNLTGSSAYRFGVSEKD